MSFVSYAQNLEDVVLWRALRGVEEGFYIDVGANDPNSDSVTKAFYDRGWRGINIEPLLSHWNDLQRDRPRDINLQCAVGHSRGELELWEADVRGWATSSPEVIEKYRREGREGVWHKVAVLTLSEICEAHAFGDIHFLKIDVEGAEQSVIDGMDFGRFRPWVMVVEATLPNSMVENYQSWEQSVLRHGYRFVYADGLNRYYLAQERIGLLSAFRYPPNVFDDFVRSDVVNLAERLQLQQSELRLMREKLMRTQESHEVQCREMSAHAQNLLARQQMVDVELARITGQYQQTVEQLNAVYRSTSWRVTAPMRGISLWLKGRGRELIKPALKMWIQRGARYVKQRPWLHGVAVATLNRMPHLKARLVPVVTVLNRPVGLDAGGASHLDGLNEHATRLHADLTAAFEKSQRERN